MLHTLSPLFERFAERHFAVEPRRRRRLTYSELAHASAALAERLIACGIRPGDRVLLVSGNSLEFVVSYFAVLRLHAVAVPLGPDEEANRIHDVIVDAQPRLALIADDARPYLVDVPTMPVDLDALASAAVAHLPEVPFAADEPIALLYTSGTTGRPKGAALRWGHFIENIMDYGHDLDVGPTTRFIVSMPMWHIDGWTYSTLQPLLFGASVTIAPLFDAHVAATFDQLLEPDHRNVLIAVPAMLSALIAIRGRRPSGGGQALNYVICGSSRLAPELQGQFERLFDTIVLQNYGSTEALLVAYYTRQIPYREGSVGRIPAKCRVRILPDGQIGVAGAYVFDGYFQDPARTGLAFEDGWYLIGDIGTVDADGYLYLHGRRNDMINKAGIKFDPVEIDEIIESHPAVVESATLGIDNERQSQDIVSFVQVCQPAADLERFVKERLPQVQWPTRIVVMDNLPRNLLGKVIKSQLRQMLTNIVASEAV
ncbi:long-chain fatty acid--CoA ligase [Parasulfuritortus cantonensis]|uniref:Long-chain fatty acid--CoA ligase n=1 Tax=Parasulfuritortus cantonensis TaxID=2528202 RepID=A0A4R1BDM4_9PROT|nr:class I adenylate-forming enzyme family protein [Parasulfuritortus cantonensis]TCJ15216.1 long-chain fatty acid--CoA ligase [Parasulfuritortus cantonensis]